MPSFSKAFLFLISYWSFKTFIIMAKFELKFIDYLDSDTSIEVIKAGNIISIFSSVSGEDETAVCIHLDKSTAIKFAKTLRTEINKITESEVYNA